MLSLWSISVIIFSFVTFYYSIAQMNIVTLIFCFVDRKWFSVKGEGRLGYYSFKAQQLLLMGKIFFIFKEVKN